MKIKIHSEYNKNKKNKSILETEATQANAKGLFTIPQMEYMKELLEEEHGKVSLNRATIRHLKIDKKILKYNLNVLAVTSFVLFVVMVILAGALGFVIGGTLFCAAGELIATGLFLLGRKISYYIEQKGRSSIYKNAEELTCKPFNELEEINQGIQEMKENLQLNNSNNNEPSPKQAEAPNNFFDNCIHRVFRTQKTAEPNSTKSLS